MSANDNAMVELDHLSKNFGAELAVNDVNLAVKQGEFVTLLGPSGCGKTTTLRCIAGLERPDGGEIRIGGDVVAAPERGIYLNPEERNIGMVFQSYAVWPHMTVFDNVAYGLRVRRAPPPALSSSAPCGRSNWWAWRISPTAMPPSFPAASGSAWRSRAPSSTSRGSCCSTSRCPISTPSCASRCGSNWSGCSRRSASPRSMSRTTKSEALVMSDRVVVMNNGVIQQIGDPQTIYARPANAFVANFIGVANLLPGTLLSRAGEFCDLEIALGEDQAPLRFRAMGGQGAVAGQKVTLSLRPEDITMKSEPPAGDRSGGNGFEGEVIDTIYLGNLMECRIRVGCHEISVQIGHYEQIVPRQKIYLSFEPDHGLCLTA